MGINEILKERMLNLNYRISNKNLERILVENNEDVNDKDAIVKSALIDQFIENFSSLLMKFITKNEINEDEVLYSGKMVLLSYPELLQIMLEVAKMNDNDRSNFILSLNKVLNK